MEHNGNLFVLGVKLPTVRAQVLLSSRRYQIASKKISHIWDTYRFCRASDFFFSPITYILTLGISFDPPFSYFLRKLNLKNVAIFLKFKKKSCSWGFAIFLSTECPCSPSELPWGGASRFHPGRGHHASLDAWFTGTYHAWMNQSPSLLLFYVSRNHHFSMIHTFCKVPSMVGFLLSYLSLIMMKLLLLYKSNPFLCPPHRPLLPGRAQPPPSSHPLSHPDLPL